MASAVFMARLLLLFGSSVAYGLLTSKQEVSHRPVLRHSAGHHDISVEIDAKSKVLATARVVRTLQHRRSDDNSVAVVPMDADTAFLKAEEAAPKISHTMAQPYNGQMEPQSISEVEEAVFDALAASQKAAARAATAADVAVRAQRAASTLVTISIFTSIIVIFLHLPRLLAAFWGRDAKSNILGFDVEALPDEEQPEQKAIEDKVIESRKEKQDVPKVHHYAALAALKIKSRTDEKEKPASPAAMAALARSSQFPAASRQLQKLAAAGVDVENLSGLTSAEFERIRRISSVYEASMPQLATKISTYRTSEKNDGMRLEWGINLENGMMKVMSVQDMPEVDIMRCVLAHTEKNLVPCYDKDTISSECCGERLENDGIWRTIIHTQSTGSKSDIVNYSSLVDALDEPSGSIWVAYYVSPEFTPASAEIPSCAESHFRTAKSLYVIRFQRLNSNSTTGVRMTSFLETGVSTAVYSLLSMMPNFALRRLVRGMVETAAESLVNFCRTSPKIDELMATSPSAELYQRLQKRLEDKK